MLWNFDTIKEHLKTSANESRLKEVNDLFDTASGKPEYKKILLVNDFFNKKLKYVEDAINWDQKDYWATPVESILRAAGDCEDYAICKYFALLGLGVEVSKLRIVYVKAIKLKQAHMVLTYRATPTSNVQVLDNIIDAIKTFSQRHDLEYVYGFNADGLYITEGTAEKRLRDTASLSLWQSLLEKMKAEGFSF